MQGLGLKSRVQMANGRGVMKHISSHVQPFMLGVTLVFGLLACSPNGFKDRVVANGELSQNAGMQAKENDWKKFKIEDKPVLDPKIHIDTHRNDLGIPQTLGHRGEQWLPRTLLVRDLIVGWNKDRSKILARGSAQWNDKITRSSGDVSFSLAGNWDTSSGISDLVMVNSEMPHEKNREQAQVRGRAYCVSVDENMECNATIVEIFVRVGSIIYSGQFEKIIEAKQKKLSGKPESSGHSNNAEDITSHTHGAASGEVSSGSTGDTDSDSADVNSTDSEFIDDEIQGFDQYLDVTDATQASDVENLFETENIEKSTDPIENKNVLPAPPSGWDKHPLPQPTEDLEINEIIDQINQKNKSTSLESVPPQVTDFKHSEKPLTSEKPLSVEKPITSEKPQVPEKTLTPEKPLTSEKSLVPQKTVRPLEGTTISKQGAHGAPLPQHKPTRGDHENAPIDPVVINNQPIDSANDKQPIGSKESSIVIPRHKPTPPISVGSESPMIKQSSSSKDDAPIASPEELTALSNTPLNNALIGPFYPYQSYGYFSNGGGLVKSSSLIAMIENIDKEKLSDRFPLRSHSPKGNKFYGNFASMDYLLRSSYWINKLRPGLALEINDISSQKGGKIGHASHQNGLDMDIGYFFKDTNHDYYGRKAIKNGMFDPKFDRALLWTFFKTMMKNYHDKIFMIFVHPSIKQAMCAEAQRVGDLGKSEKDVMDPVALHALRRLMPDPKRGHDGHFHTRIRCPDWAKQPVGGKKAPAQCVMPRGDIPIATGCWKRK